MTLMCRLRGCDFQLLVVDGGPLRMRCTRCLCQTEGLRYPIRKITQAEWFAKYGEKAS